MTAASTLYSLPPIAKEHPPFSFVLFIAVCAIPFINVMYNSLGWVVDAWSAAYYLLLALVVVVPVDYFAICYLWKQPTRSKELQLGWACWAGHGFPFLGAVMKVLDMTLRGAELSDRVRIPIGVVSTVLCIPVYAAGQVLFVRQDWIEQQQQQVKQEASSEERQSLRPHGDSNVWAGCAVALLWTASSTSAPYKVSPLVIILAFTLTGISSLLSALATFHPSNLVLRSLPNVSFLPLAFILPIDQVALACVEQPPTETQTSLARKMAKAVRWWVSTHIAGELVRSAMTAADVPAKVNVYVRLGLMTLSAVTFGARAGLG